MTIIKNNSLSLPYYQQRNLLFQFLLSELLVTYKALQQLDEQVTGVLMATNKELEFLTSAVTQLVGSAQACVRFFPWYQDGSLSKLKYYSTLLSQSSRAQGKHYSEMHREANQAWLIGIQILDALRLHSEDGFKPLTRLTKRLKHCILRVSKLITRAASEFQEDENVLFFLLQHRQALQQLYGESYLKRLIRDLLPEKNTVLEEFLVKRYSGRGFDQLVKKIREFQTCHSPT